MSLLHHVLINDTQQIYANAEAIYQDDLLRGVNLPSDLREALITVLNKLDDDIFYKKEYEQFVTNMCFGHTIAVSFESVTSTLKSILQVN